MAISVVRATKVFDLPADDANRCIADSKHQESFSPKAAMMSSWVRIYHGSSIIFCLEPNGSRLRLKGNTL